MVLLHSFLKTWGEFLRRLLALAKRRRMRDYDAVTLSAACNSPVLITEGLAGVRGKEILPSPVDKSSRLVKDEEKASYDKLPLSLTEAVECAKKSAFLQNSPCKDIANRFIEVIEQEAM